MNGPGQASAQATGGLTPVHPAGTAIVAVVGTRYADYDLERSAFAAAGADVRVCWDPEEALDATIVLAGSPPAYTAAVLERMRRCRAIIRYGVGVDRIDVDAAQRLGIEVHNVPDFCVEEVATHAVAMILAFSRRLLDGDRRVRSGGWGLESVRPIKATQDERVAIIGAGRIGSATEAKLRALGFQTVVHDAFLKPVPSIDEALAGADYVTLHVPHTPETNHLLDAGRLARLAPRAVVVNTSRGPLVDQAALLAALSAGAIRGAALDVYESEPLPADSPLREREDVLLTPHMAWYSERSELTVREKAVSRAVDVLRR